MQTITTRTWNFLGSYKLAIILIAVLGIILGWATFYESSTSTAKAAANFYHTAWFAVLLFLIFVNITVSALRRWPWQQKHIGFLITHFAIDLLLIGAFLTVVTGVEGTMSIAEGASTNNLALDSTVIRVDELPGQAVRAGARIALPDGAVVKVDQLLENAMPALDVKDDGQKDNPAIHFTLGNGKATSDGWLVARSADLASQSFGPLNASLAEVKALPDSNVKPHLVLTFGKKVVEVPVGKVDDVVAVPNTEYSVKISKLYERAGVDKKDLVERTSGQANPAITFELTRDGARPEKHVSFSRFSDFPTYMGAKSEPPSGVKVRYERGGAGSGGGPTVSFYLLPDKKLYVGIKGETQAVEIGKAIGTPWMGMMITVDKIVDKARISQVYQPAPQGNPAVQLSLGEEKAWLGFDDNAVLGGHKVSFGSDSKALGVNITLKQFELKTNPGTNTPASYASLVEVADANNHFSYKISMNEPLSYAGYTFFQSGYAPGQGGPTTTILRVAKDPGLLVKDAGTILLVIGIAWLFYLEPRLAKRRAEARFSVAAKEGKKHARLAGAAPTTVIALALVLFATGVGEAKPGRQVAQAPAPQATTSEAPNPHGGGEPAGDKAPAPAIDANAPNPHSPDMLAKADIIPGPTSLNLEPLRRLPVQANGRVRPFDTFAREIVLTVTARESFEGYDPVDLVMSWTAHGPAWAQKPVIYVGNKALKSALGLDPEQNRFELKGLAGNQKLHDLAQAGRQKDQNATTVEREAVTVFDRVSLLQAVIDGRVLAIVPPSTDKEASWLSPSDLGGMDPESANLVVAVFRAYADNDAKVTSAASALETAMRVKGGEAYPTAQALDLELLYNKFRPFRTAWELYLAALIFFGLGAYWKSLRYIAMTLALGGFTVHTGGMVLRTLISNRAPVTNMYESIVYVAWGCAGFGLALAWKYRHSGAAVAAGVMSTLLLVLADALPGALDPSIQPLMPVLRNNFWLTVHVLTITLSYAAFALATALGHFWLVFDMRGKTESRVAVTHFLNATLRVGVLLLAAGTLLGGVWAQYSWGRFWGWDPKEVWALIALLGYLALLHAQFAGWIGPRGLAIGSIAGFLGVLMAWYGVNYVLGKGLHSYGFGSGGTQWVFAYLGAELLFLALTTARKRASRSVKSERVAN